MYTLLISRLVFSFFQIKSEVYRDGLVSYIIIL